MIRRLIIATMAILVPFLAFSQSSNLGNWLILFGNKQINTKYNWHHEVQYRNYDAIGDLEQLLLRTGIGMNVGDRSNALLGYGYIKSQNYIGSSEDKLEINEHRIYQQFITKQSIGKFKLQHRYRFEQRFVEEDFRLRFRYFLGINYPILRAENSGQEWYLSMYNEIFLNTVQNAFDRNRLYGGLGYKVSEKLKFEIGYMNQFLNALSRDQLNLICFINW